MDEQEQTIDLMELLKVLRKNLLVIVLVTMIAGLMGFVLARFIIPRKYTSETLMYVENSVSKSEESAININDINAAQKLVNTCQILFTSDYTLGELSKAFDGKYTVSQLMDMVTVSSVNNTEVLKISIVSGSPDESYQLNMKLSELAKSEFMRVIKNGSIETVSDPSYPLRHTFPSTMKFTLIGALLGLCGTYFVCLVIELMDIKVKPSDDLSEIYDIPVFAEILDFKITNGTRYASTKDGYSGYDNYRY